MMFELWVRWRKPQESDWHGSPHNHCYYSCDTNDHHDDHGDDDVDIDADESKNWR